MDWTTWRNTPAVDHETGLLYVTTGNNFSIPEGVCRYPTQKDCKPASPGNDIDSIVALNLKSGKIVWATPTLPADMSTNFDHKDGPDYDFGSDPNLFSTTIGGHRRTLVGAGQKSGFYWALDAATGAIKWSFESGGAVVSGAAIVDGSVYWGSGYHTKILGLPYAGDNHKIFAFAVAKQ